VTCLVTGATGNVGSLVTQRLIDRGDRPCVFVRDPKKARELFGDLVEIRVGDLVDISGALAGISDIFLLNSGPDLEIRDRAAALASKAAGVRHLVKLSTLDVSTGVGTGSWHARGEHGEMASRIGAAIGKAIRFEQISDEDARSNFDRAYAEALVDICRAIREGRLATVTDGVQQVLGRKPVTFDQWAEEHAGAFRRSGTTRGKRGQSVRPPSSAKQPK
jgi:uncharacterized protein YbjT (DUF2867 family)